jgi:hypothetical protein
MLDDAIISALNEIRISLKTKYPDRTTRISYIILICCIAIIPILLFDYWIGRISGLIIVSGFFLKLIWGNNLKKKNKEIRE